MANDRHTMFFMGKEYPNVAMGGGSGGGGIDIDSTILYESTQRENVINLDDDYTNYDFLMIQAYGAVNNGYLNSTLVAVADMSTGINIGLTDDISYIWYTITNTDTFTLASSGGTQYYVKTIYGLKLGSGGGGGSSSGINYSTEEKIVGSWIDGRPIYQITLGTDRNTPLPNSIDVSALDIDILIWSNGIGSDQNPMGNTIWSLNSVSANQNRIIYLNPKTTLKREGGFYVYFITLQYVKNADSQ